jgi:hypothetical protein
LALAANGARGIIMMRLKGLAAVMAVLLVGCGSGTDNGTGGAVGGSTGTGTGGTGTGGTGSGGALAAPQGIQYSLATGEVGMPYGPYQPTVTGTVTGYAVTPALPAGLTLDAVTGAISGMPVAGSSAAYTVTASNAAGSATAALTIVVLVPPTLTYAGPVTGAVGQPLAQVVPTLGGNADYIYFVPRLPDGLTLDPVTGIISGTPSHERVALTYLITAGNNGGASATAELVLAVRPPPAGTALTGVFRDDTVIGLGYSSGTHSGLTDTSGAFTYEEGQGIAFSVGAVSIGSIPAAKALVTPMDLVPQGTTTSSHLLNVERFLLMLDHDGNPNNGIQISADVTAAAASWTPVDFDSADLPATLGPIIQQTTSLDGTSHVLPDAAAAQAHLLKAFYCTHSGNYSGTFSDANVAGSGRGGFTATLFANGSMHSVAAATGTLAGFDAYTSDAASTLLDGSFAQSSPSPGVLLQGAFADAFVLQGTYQAAAAGSFLAIADASAGATYKYTGSYTSTRIDQSHGPFTVPFFISVDDSNGIGIVGYALGQPRGGLTISTLAGTVSGTTFTGTATYVYPGNGRSHTFQSPVSGTYYNLPSGITFDAKFNSVSNQEVVTFSFVGCRAN